MRIVTRKELMALPPGTLYHEWQPCSFGDLCIKGETIPASGTFRGDWLEQAVPWLRWDDDCAMYCDVLDKLDSGAAIPVELACQGREALFDDSLRYAVWEYDDVKALYAKISECMGAFD